jgi:hypothetical protein
MPIPHVQTNDIVALLQKKRRGYAGIYPTRQSDNNPHGTKNTTRRGPMRETGFFLRYLRGNPCLGRFMARKKREVHPQFF